jgi:hypothetical protein
VQLSALIEDRSSIAVMSQSREGGPRDGLYARRAHSCAQEVTASRYEAVLLSNPNIGRNCHGQYARRRLGGWRNVRFNLGHCVRGSDGLGDGYDV